MSTRFYTLSELYPDKTAAADRVQRAMAQFDALFGARDDRRLLCAPGRTELAGNHTDHNHGRVLAAAVNLDLLAVVSPRADGKIHVCSKGFAPIELSVTALAPRTDEAGTSAALIRGVCAHLHENGATVGGFDAFVTSDVPQGSGLSSSAAYEVLIGTIQNDLYNDGALSPVQLAMAAVKAENVYFGKPCGQMDQMACAVGGAVAIDFADPTAPQFRRIDVDFDAAGRVLCVVNTGGSHADLTDDYAAIPAEMKSVAKALGGSFLRDIPQEKFLSSLSALRGVCGDRATLRAMHFFSEDTRAEKMARALEKRDFSTYEKLMRESGDSSFKFLQNLYSNRGVSCQGLSLAICLAEQILEGEGVSRVHGGGFAGTTQHLLPIDRYNAFSAAMEAVFGTGCCHRLHIRPVGGARLHI